MKIALFQFNPIAGDISYNKSQIINAIQKSRSEGCDILVTPELALCGYFALDMLLHSNTKHLIENALQDIKQESKDIAVIVGSPYYSSKISNHNLSSMFNSAFVFKNMEYIGRYDKMIIPSYNVFNENRYFSSGENPFVFKINNHNVGIVICEDIWHDGPIQASIDASANFLISLNASPYMIDKHDKRISAIKHIIKDSNIPFLYVNQVGFENGLVFDGASFMLDSNLQITQAPRFDECLSFVVHESVTVTTEPPLYKYHALLQDEYYEQVYNTLTFAINNYFKSNNFNGVVVGVSGGIDSAIVLAIASTIIDKNSIIPIFMPSRFTSHTSRKLAKQLCDNLDLKMLEIPIDTLMKEYDSLISIKSIKCKTHDQLNHVSTLNQTSYGNLQARIRGNILMAFSNQNNYLLLNTSNKSELATGYGTLYGDMCGGISIIGDLYKTQVYKLTQIYNTLNAKHCIPQAIINRAPSAELHEGQLDSDTLPHYEILDEILDLLITSKLSIDEISSTHGFDKTIVAQVHNMLAKNEYKRFQFMPIIKINDIGFGSEWQYPINRSVSTKPIC